MTRNHAFTQQDNAPHENLCTHSDPRSTRFTSFGVAEGLSQSTVSCILRDSRGVMWFGSQNGLNYFNGYDFDAFHHDATDPQSICSNSAHALAEDANAHLWVATGKGLSRYDPSRKLFDTFLVNAPDETSVSANTFQAMLTDRDCGSTLWLASAYGLAEFNTGTLGFDHYTVSEPGLAQSANQIRCMVDDGQGSLWLGTFGSGLLRFDKESRQFARPLSQGQELKVTALHIIGEGQFLVGTEKQGLFVLDAVTSRLSRHPNSNLFSASLVSLITTIGEDPDGRLWIGTSDRGVLVYCPDCGQLSGLSHDRFDPASLPGNWIRSIFLDPEGRVWVGTLTGGVSIYDPSKYKFSHVRSLPSRQESLGGNVVRGFCRDREGRLWVGTESGLSRLDESGHAFVHYVSDDNDQSSINSNLVRGLHVDREGEMWVFTWHGICRYDQDKDSFIRVGLPEGYNLPIRDTDLRYRYLDSQGSQWYGSENGLVRVDPDGEFILYDSNPANPHRIIGDRQRFFFETSDGRLLLSTMSGHCSIDIYTGQVTNFGHSKAIDAPMSRNFILCYHEDEGALWYGTMGALFRHDKADGTWLSYGSANGFANDVIYAILPDATGNLWMSTNRGLVCFDPALEHCRNYGLSDGLQAHEFNNNAYFLDVDGTMYFGGVNGYNYFHPGDIVDSECSVDLIFTRLQISSVDVPSVHDISVGGVLHVPYSARSVDIHFTALEYSHPGKIQYAYQMSGSDADWVYCGGQRSASYRALPPGEHLFRVRSTNRDGVWCENTISLLVKVEQPQWFLRLAEGGNRDGVASELRRYLEDMELRAAHLEAERQNLTHLNQSLAYAAFHDALTGVHNRAGYMQAMERFLSSDSLPLGLIIVDVDGLKLVNDNLGHTEGDALIRRAADKLSQCRFSGEHIVARVGGDEFALLIANCSREELALACTQVGCGGSGAEEGDPASGFLSLSSGCAHSDDVPLGQLFNTADERMYIYKRTHGARARKAVLSYIQQRSDQIGEGASGAISKPKVPR